MVRMTYPAGWSSDNAHDGGGGAVELRRDRRY